jgi:hypothetical protein
MKTFIKNFRLSETTFQIISDLPITDKTFHPKFKLFEVTECTHDIVQIHHHFSIPEKITALLDRPDTRNVFSNQFLSIFKSKNHWIYQHKQSQQFNIKYNALVVFNTDYTVGDVYTNELNADSYAVASLGSLVLFGGDHYLLANLFASRKGLLLHGNGLLYNGRGIILLGESGAGKSTLSALLKTRGFKLIADDRIVLQQKRTGHFMLGSWCHGSVIDVTNTEAMVDKIFFLEQARENNIMESKHISDILKQVACSIVRPFGDQTKWQSILDQIDELVKENIFYTLSFDLSGKIANNIKEQL